MATTQPADAATISLTGSTANWKGVRFGGSSQFDYPSDTQAGSADLSLEAATPVARGLPGRSSPDKPGTPGILSESQASIPDADRVVVPPREIVFIDAAVADWPILAAAVRPGAEIIVLDPSGDELAQISTALATRHEIRALHIVSHGEPGALLLGSTRLDRAALDREPVRFAQWRTSLAAEADVLLYGCNVARDSAGRDFLACLSDALAAAVAASTNVTGATPLGGDWQLETSTGPRRVASLFGSSVGDTYRHILPSGTVTFSSSTGISGNTVSDGQGGSTDISGISLQFSCTSYYGGSSALPMTYQANIYSGASALAAGYAVSDPQGTYTIRSSSTAVNFALQSLFIVDVGGAGSLKIEGFDNGASTGSVTVNPATSPFYFTYNTTTLTPSKFQNIDEVRISGSGGNLPI